MSSIVIFLDSGANHAEITFRPHKATGRNLSDIRDALQKNAPIVEVNLFQNDCDSKAAMPRSVLTCIDEFSLSGKIYELPEGKSMKTCKIVDKFEVSETTLVNILNEADAELDRQLE